MVVVVVVAVMAVMVLVMLLGTGARMRFAGHFLNRPFEVQCRLPDNVSTRGEMLGQTVVSVKAACRVRQLQLCLVSAGCYLGAVQSTLPSTAQMTIHFKRPNSRLCAWLQDEKVK